MFVASYRWRLWNWLCLIGASVMSYTYMDWCVVDAVRSSLRSSRRRCWRKTPVSLQLYACLSAAKSMFTWVHQPSKQQSSGADVTCFVAVDADVCYTWLAWQQFTNYAELSVSSVRCATCFGRFWWRYIGMLTRQQLCSITTANCFIGRNWSWVSNYRQCLQPLSHRSRVCPRL